MFSLHQVRLTSFFVIALLLTSSLASAMPGITAFGGSIGASLFRHKQGGSDFTDTPGAVDLGAYPQVQPVYRGDFYSADDVAQTQFANTVEAGTATYPTDFIYNPSGDGDTGDNQSLVGRAVALPRNVSSSWEDLNAYFQLYALHGGIGATHAASKPAAKGQTAVDGPGGSLQPIGGAAPTFGEPFPWEGTAPSGGSPAAPAVANPQTGNCLTTMPIVGWRIPGGMSLGLTLYHNSQDNIDIGWGTNWRSNYDLRVVPSAKVTTVSGGKTTYSTKATVIYPDGMRLVYSNSYTTPSPQSNRFFPPTGFYDILVKSGSGWLLRTKSQVVYLLDSNGYLTAIQDRYGNQIAVSRDPSSHLLTAASDSYGGSITFNNATAAFGSYLVTHYSYAHVGTQSYAFTYAAQSYNHIPVLRTVTWPTLSSGGSYAETFYYDAGAGILSEYARDGRVYKFTYDGTERLTSFGFNGNYYSNPVAQTGSLGGLTYTYTYGPTSTTLTEPNGKTVVMNYSIGLLQSIKDQAGYSDDYTWDNSYNLGAYRSKRGYTSLYTYDPYGNMTSSQDARQAGSHKTESAIYNSYNDVISVTDTRGAITHLNVDPNTGVLLNVVDGLGNTLVTNTYNSNGELVTTSSEGATTTINYGSNGRPSSIVTPDQTYTVSYYTSPLPGLVSTVTDSLSRSTNFYYDNWGRKTSLSRADGTSASIILDPVGRPTTITDWNGLNSVLSYDAVGRLTTSQNPRGDVQTLYWWDTEHIAGVKDGNSHTRTYTYDARWQNNYLTFADGMVEQYMHDADGNFTRRYNGLGQAINYAYDSADNLTGTTYPAGTGVTYAYDLDGRATSMTDSTGTTSWTYDLGDRLTNFASPQGSIAYSYDSWGRRTLLNEGGGVTIGYGYTNQRLTSVTKMPENEVTTWAYDSIGRLASQGYPNGVTASYSYDTLDRLASLTHTSSLGASILAESYVYDNDSNMTQKTSNGSSTYYGYDGANQLGYEGNASSWTSATSWIKYAYDANGNRTTRSNSSGLNETYTYDAGDKLLSIANNGTQTRAYGYDGAGRPYAISSAGGTVTLGYDYEDRVTSLTPLGGLTVNHYSYNALDARVGKTDSTGSYTYLRDGVGASDPLLSDGFAKYMPGISRHDSSGTRFNHDDFLGTHKADTDSSGSVQATRSYDAFGNLVSATGSTSGPFGFAGSVGYQEDTDAGSKLLGHRFYDPSTGRFLTRDPAHSGHNWFGYCDNNPTAYQDPTGQYIVTVGIRAVYTDPFGKKYYHIFIDVLDDDPLSPTFGTTFRFEGEPQHVDGPPLHNYGALEVEELTNPETAKESIMKVALFEPGKSADTILAILRAHKSRINNLHYPYNPLRAPNSNTAAYEMLGALGLLYWYISTFMGDGMAIDASQWPHQKHYSVPGFAPMPRWSPRTRPLEH